MNVLDLSDFEKQSAQQIKQNQLMDLISVPPSVLEKQQKQNQQSSVTQHGLSSQGFYSRVISAKVTGKNIKTTTNADYFMDKKASITNYEGSLEKDFSAQRSMQKSNTQSYLDPAQHSLYNLIIQKDEQINELQKKFSLQRNISSRQQNKQGINFMTGFADKVIKMLREVSQWQIFEKEQREQIQDIISQTIDFINGMNDIFRVQQHHIQLCTQRLTQTEHILKIVEQLKNQQVKDTDLFALRKAITNLNESVTSFQTNELNANYLFRDLQKANLQIAQIQSQYEKTQKICEYSEKTMHQIKKQYQITNEENLYFKKNLRRERDQNTNNQKRVVTLEQRLDVLRGSENYKKDKDSMRNIIEDMIKENEQNKRKAFQKNQEVIKLEQQLNEQKDQTTRLQKRNYLLEKQLRTFGFNVYDLIGPTNLFQKSKPPKSCNESSEDIDSNGASPTNVFQKDNLEEIYEKGLPPKKLDFKLSNLKLDYKKLLHEVITSGPKQTLDYINKQKEGNEKFNCLMLFMDQYAQFKYLGENINSIVRFACEALELSSNESLMHFFASSIPEIISSEKACLWLIDQQTTTFYTINEQRQTIFAFIDQDSIFQMVKSQKPVYNKSDNEQANIPFYRDANTNEQKFVKDCILIPIQIEGRIIGFLSAVNFPVVQNTIQNGTYILTILSFIAGRLLQKFSQIRLLNYQLKYKNLLYETMQDLCRQNDMFKFQKSVIFHAEQLFGVNSTLFYYYQQHNLMLYTSKNQFVQHSSNSGVAGFVAKTQHNLIVSNIQSHQSYHQRIDLNSQFPVYLIVILQDKDLLNNDNKPKGSPTVLSDSEDNNDQQITIGVLEISLNNRARLSKNGKKIDLSQFIGPQDTIQTMAQMFSKVVSISYKYMCAILQK